MLLGSGGILCGGRWVLCPTIFKGLTSHWSCHHRWHLIFDLPVLWWSLARGNFTNLGRVLVALIRWFQTRGCVYISCTLSNKNARTLWDRSYRNRLLWPTSNCIGIQANGTKWDPTLEILNANTDCVYDSDGVKQTLLSISCKCPEILRTHAYHFTNYHPV